MVIDNDYNPQKTSKIVNENQKYDKIDANYIISVILV